MGGEDHRISPGSSSSFDSCTDLLESSAFQQGFDTTCQPPYNWHVESSIKFERQSVVTNETVDDFNNEDCKVGDGHTASDPGDVIGDAPEGHDLQVHEEGHAAHNANADGSIDNSEVPRSDFIPVYQDRGSEWDMDCGRNEGGSSTLYFEGDLHALEKSIRSFDIQKADTRFPHRTSLLNGVLTEDCAEKANAHVSPKVVASQESVKRSVCWVEQDLGSDEIFRYLEYLELKETYLDTVDLKDDHNSNEKKRDSFCHGDTNLSMGPQTCSSTATASSKGGLFKVDWIEVVGARQKKGGSSLGERLIGVKDHAVYCIKVTSGQRVWEVFRRYHEFNDLNCQLRRVFISEMGLALPSPWEKVEGDWYSFFGNTSPRVVEARCHLIERCLQSLLKAGPPFNNSSPLFWFLRPHPVSDSLSTKNVSPQHFSTAQLRAFDLYPGVQPHEPSDMGVMIQEDQNRDVVLAGKPMKLVLKVHSSKYLDQILHAQKYSCAGCYRHLSLQNGLVNKFSQVFQQQKPRLCEYTGYLFCASCHLKETSVLPAQVLRHWDFTPRRVSQLAKAYLNSIYDQPILCLSSVNPYLFSRVPTLGHLKELRRKLSRLLSCVRCPFRAQIQLNMGSRHYLLENNDYFALRDLEDVSKGVFAVLPGVLRDIYETLKAHITRHCSVCQAAGEWCGAGIICEYPFSALFPFQDEDSIECKKCHATFHQKCFSKCGTCPCCPHISNKNSSASEKTRH